MSKSILIALIAALLPVAAQADDDAIARGREKSQVCQACHGADGIGSDPQYPVIAGQYADYLAHSMRAYTTGERSDVVMQGFMATLSEQDITDLAAYYASQAGPLGDLSHLK